MKTKAVRLYGVNDLRLEEFELPALREDEILAEARAKVAAAKEYAVSCEYPDESEYFKDVYVD